MADRLLDDDAIVAFARDGAICVRQAFDTDWLDLVARGIERNIADPGPTARLYTPDGAPGRFFGDYCNWNRIPEYETFMRQSPAAQLAAEAMGSPVARIFHEHVLVKEPGTRERTPWHHDQPYYCIDGDQICSIWLSLDRVPREAGVEFVAGTHASGKMYMPRLFLNHENYDYEPGSYEDVPDIDSRRGEFRILGWDLEPGDCVIFHARTLHGAPGTEKLQNRRRGFATRWLGADTTYATRPGETSPPFPELKASMKPGDPMDLPIFPVVWSA